MWQSGTRALRLAYGQMFLIATNTSGDDGQDWKRSWLVKRVTQQVPIMEQELPALPEHMNSPPIFVVQSLVYSVVFYRSLFVFFFFWSS
jgi:hypothetical protein